MRRKSETHWLTICRQQMLTRPIMDRKKNINLAFQHLRDAHAHVCCLPFLSLFLKNKDKGFFFLVNLTKIIFVSSLFIHSRRGLIGPPVPSQMLIGNHGPWGQICCLHNHLLLIFSTRERQDLYRISMLVNCSILGHHHRRSFAYPFLRL